MELAQQHTCISVFYGPSWNTLFTGNGFPGTLHLFLSQLTFVLTCVTNGSTVVLLWTRVFHGDTKPLCWARFILTHKEWIENQVLNSEPWSLNETLWIDTEACEQQDSHSLYTLCAKGGPGVGLSSRSVPPLHTQWPAVLGHLTVGRVACLKPFQAFYWCALRCFDWDFTVAQELSGTTKMTVYKSEFHSVTLPPFSEGQSILKCLGKVSHSICSIRAVSGNVFISL